MTYTISKEFAFSASHQLHGLRDGHPCGRVHGHNYVVRIQLRARSVAATGFVVDYGDLKPVSQWLDDNLDHRHLNDVLAFQPSAENMARFLAELVPTLVPLPSHVTVAVAVSETPKTWAEWSP